MHFVEATMIICPSLFSCFRTFLVAVVAGVAVTAFSAAPEARSLFNGKNLEGWHEPTGDWMVAEAAVLDPGNPQKFAIQAGAGILVNGVKGKTVNLVTEEEFGDLEVHIEFCIPRRSNSGIYLMGRYEVQVYDSFGVEKDQYPGIECGGIYGRWINKQNVEGHSPRVNASKPAGEWQSFDVTFRAPRFDGDGKKTANARFVKIVHNGQVIHENVEVSGPTRSARYTDEKSAGPLLLQGDHGPVAYRNLTIRRLELK